MIVMTAAPCCGLLWVCFCLACFALIAWLSHIQYVQDAWWSESQSRDRMNRPNLLLLHVLLYLGDDDVHNHLFLLLHEDPVPMRVY